jgi:hypothetical protein
MKKYKIFFAIGIIGILISLLLVWFGGISSSPTSEVPHGNTVTPIAQKYCKQYPAESEIIKQFYYEYGDDRQVDEYLEKHGIVSVRAFNVLGVAGLRTLEDSQVGEGFQQCLRKEYYQDFKPILRWLANYVQDAQQISPARISNFFLLLAQLKSAELRFLAQQPAGLPLLLLEPQKGRDTIRRYGLDFLEILYQFSPESYPTVLEAFSTCGDALLCVYRFGAKENKGRDYVHLYGIEFRSIAQVVYHEADRLLRDEYQQQIRKMDMPAETLQKKVEEKLISDTLFFLLKNCEYLRQQRRSGNDEEKMIQEIRVLCDYGLFKLALQVPYSYRLFCETSYDRRDQTKQFLERYGGMGGPIFLYSKLAEKDQSLRQDIIHATLQHGDAVLLSFARLMEEGLSPHVALRNLKVKKYKNQFLYQLAQKTLQALQTKQNLEEAVSKLLKLAQERGDQFFADEENRENRSLVWDLIPGYEVLHLIKVVYNGYSPTWQELMDGGIDGVKLAIFTMRAGARSDQMANLPQRM